MKFLIDGVEYDASAIDPSGADLAAMSRQAGMGFQTWNRIVGEIERLSFDEDGNVVVLTKDEAAADPGRVDPTAFMDSPRHMDAFNVLMWLARRAAGERISFAESSAVPFSRIDRIEDDEPEPEIGEETEDPTPPPASAPESGGEAATSTTSSTA